MKLNQIWHCPRPALAQSYLALLGAGPVASTSIFAPRRTGKTAFLRQDLTPAAREAGYVVAYADLWQTRLSPGIALIRGLEEALEPASLARKALNKLKQPIKKVKAKGSVGAVSGELEVELNDARKESAEMALRIEDLVAQLCTGKPLLLLVDEAQELARNKDNELVATAIRTALTKHRDKMRVVFTGSSRSQLAHVFSRTGAPLYSVGATVHDFPLLGRELVEFVADKFKLATQRTLDVEQGWQEFLAFKQQPEPFLSAVVAMMMNPALTLAETCAAERLEQDKAENHEGTWEALDALQRQLLKLFASNPVAKPFSKSVLAQLAKSLGLPSLDAASVQFSLKKLADRTILSKSPQGSYLFESDAFERWVRTLAED